MNPFDKLRVKYIDCHTHAHFAAFKDDYKEVINRALEAGVAVINVGTQKDTSAKAVEVAHQFRENVLAVVGLHPIHTDKSFHDEQELGLLTQTNADSTRTDAEKKSGGFTPLEVPSKIGAGTSSSLPLTGFTSRGEDFDYEYYKKLALDDRVVAIGECGLDYYHLERGTWNVEQKSKLYSAEASKGKQKEVFIKQIELAREVGKPLMIHCRGSTGSPSDAFGDLITILEGNKKKLNERPGVVHFFTGTKDHAKELLDMGFYFTFGGVVTFTRDYDEIIKMIPLDRILSETDAPYVTPEPFRGKRNEPVYVVYVVRKLAELKGVSEEVMVEQIWKNAKEMFGI